MNVGMIAKRQLDRLKVNLGARVKPKFLNFITTKRCNSRCTYCNIWKIARERPEEIKSEMTLEEIRQCLDRDRDMLDELEFLQLTGGEPFLRDDLEDIMRAFYEVSPLLSSVWIPSNGLLGAGVSSRAKKMVEDNSIRNFGISVSIDGNEEFHDKVRGVPGGYKKAVKLLKELSALSEESDEFSASLGFTIGPSNWRQLPQVYELSKELGVEFTTRPVNFSSVYYGNERADVGLSEGEISEVGVMLEEIYGDLIKRDTGLRPWNLRAYYSGIVRYLRGPDKRFFPCYAAALSFMLNAQGDVYPCLYMSSKLGNIREDSLKDIWDSEKTKEVWQQIKKEKCPNCWVECETQRNITYAVEKALTFK